MKLTIRQKEIASGCYGFEASIEYYKQVMLKARAHYWNDVDNEQYVAISSTGRREYFVYNFYSSGKSKDWGLLRKQKEWKKLAKHAASLWAKNKYKSARQCDEMNWENYRSFYV
jgi:hypothetical protein